MAQELVVVVAAAAGKVGSGMCIVAAVERTARFVTVALN